MKGLSKSCASSFDIRSFPENTVSAYTLEGNEKTQLWVWGLVVLLLFAYFAFDLK